MVSIPNLNNTNSSNYLSLSHISNNSNTINSNYSQNLLQIKPLQSLSYSLNTQNYLTSGQSASIAHELSNVSNQIELNSNEQKNILNPSSHLIDNSNLFSETSFNKLYDQNEYINKYNINNNSVSSTHTNFSNPTTQLHINTSSYSHVNNGLKSITQHTNIFNPIYQNNYFEPKDYNSGFNMTNLTNNGAISQYYKPNEMTNSNDFNFQNPINYQNQYEQFLLNNNSLNYKDNQNTLNQSSQKFILSSAFEPISSSPNNNFSSYQAKNDLQATQNQNYEKLDLNNNNNKTLKNSNEENISVNNSINSTLNTQMGYLTMDKLDTFNLNEKNKKPISHKTSSSNQKKTRTKDKYRVVYNELQRTELEKEFNFSKYITSRRKSELASILDLSQRQIKIWFQNRRAKDRKIIKKKKNDISVLNVDSSYRNNVYNSEVNVNLAQVNFLNNYGSKQDLVNWQSENILTQNSKPILNISSVNTNQLNNPINSKNNNQNISEIYPIFGPN